LFDDDDDDDDDDYVLLVHTADTCSQGRKENMEEKSTN